MKRPGKIIFIPYIHAFGGVERLVLTLSKFLHEQDLDHTVACFSETINFSAYAEWPITVHELTPRRNPISEGWALNRYLRAAYAAGSPPPLLFDLKGTFYAGMFPAPNYHLHLTDPPSLLPSEVSKFAFSLRHAYPSFGKDVRPGLTKIVRAEIVHRINRRGASNALSVIAMTNLIANELHMLYSLDAKIIRPGVRMPTSLPLSRVEIGDKVRMLSVCRLEPNKRLYWILNALAGLESSDVALSKKADWVVDLVGDGSQREELQNLAVQLGIAERVVFHGRVSDASVEELFADAGFFLMPAVQGYGLPALEALARSVPVILHRESGVSEILKGTPWAEVIEDGLEDLASAINIMVDRCCGHVLEKSPLPAFPTETDWARNICMQCKWI
jgi:glycosyltransferase involved in cell wall biosynthesis